MKIKQKMTFGFMGIAVLIGIGGGTALYFQNKLIKDEIVEKISRAEQFFLDLKERDTQILSSALEIFVQDQAFKDVYMEKNREKLYNYGQPLFQKLKNKYGITHFYFILPNGQCFTRLHNKEIYGDLITRFTFWEARDTGKAASGIELGKTAFALRVVMPYYNDNELIGYVEFGEEINHFLEILKGKTNNEFVIFIDKKYLDRDKWRSVKQTAGLRDNWDDLEDHVIASDTTTSDTTEAKAEIITRYFTEENLERIEKGETFLRQVKAKDKTFAFGGFSIVDAGGRHAGAVLSLLDVTARMEITQKSRLAMLSITAILFIIAFGTSFFISRSISRPIIKLMDIVTEIGQGNLDVSLEDINSKDEIGILGNSLNKMVKDLKHFIERERVLSAKVATAELERKRAIDLEKAYKKLQEMQGMLIQAEKLNAVGQLASGVAHEVKNPLAMIIQGVNYLEKRVSAKEEDIFDTLTILKDSVKRADKIISGLLDFSRATTLDLQPADINSILENSLSLVKNQFKFELIEIVRELKANIPKVLVDKNKIEQVCVNVLLNADQAMPKGGKIIIRSYDKRLEEIKNGIGRRAEDCFRVGEKAVIVEFEDTGIGISEKNINKIFDPFFTTKGPKGGTGLGLGISRNILRMHRGLIYAESRVGKGTKITIILKIAGG